MKNSPDIYEEVIVLNHTHTTEETKAFLGKRLTEYNFVEYRDNIAIFHYPVDEDSGDEPADIELLMYSILEDDKYGTYTYSLTDA